MTSKIESGVRKYQKRGLWQQFRQWRYRLQLGKLGQAAYIEENTQFLRYPEKVFIGSHVIIKSGATLCATNPNATIKIGDWTTIGYHTYLFATEEISVGQNCLIAPFVYIVDSNHGIARNSLIREQKMSADAITIGDDTWIGTHSTILKGVSIGRGCVIGAGAVVCDDIPEFSIAKGNPAKIVGIRQ